MMKIGIILLLLISLGYSLNMTTVKTCTNSTATINTCANSTNSIGIANWTIREDVASGPYNGTITLTNSSINLTSGNIMVRSYAGYFFPAGSHVVGFYLYNYSSSSWYRAANLTNNALNWNNISVSKNDFAPSGSVYAMYLHNSSANPAHTGIVIDYFDVYLPTVCDSSIQFSAGMSLNNTVIPHNYLISAFNYTMPDPLCFESIICNLTYANGSLYKTLTTLTNGASSLNMTGIAAYYDSNGVQLPYSHACELETVGSDAITETRDYTFNITTSFGSANDDSLLIGTIITLALLSLLFFYLHAHSQNIVWNQAWLFFGCLMVIADLLAISWFSQQNSATAISDISIALVLAFSFVFMISMLIFIWTLMTSLFLSIMKKVGEL